MIDERADREALELLVAESKWRKQKVREPLRLKDVLSQLMARRGYSQEKSLAEQGNAWNEIVGEQVAAQTRPGLVRRGVLEVFVSNSTLLQELSFRKRELIGKLAARLPNQKIRDLRFRAGSVS